MQNNCEHIAGIGEEILQINAVVEGIRDIREEKQKERDDIGEVVRKYTAKN